jgi:hypothetical protein
MPQNLSDDKDKLKENNLTAICEGQQKNKTNSMALSPRANYTD